MSKRLPSLTIAALGAALATSALAAPHTAPPAPPVVEPHHDLYDGQPARPAPAAEASGFRITVPMCQRAQRQNDPLANSAECVKLLEAARDQAEACRKAFEEGNDAHVLSPACRQAAGFR